VLLIGTSVLPGEHTAMEDIPLAEVRMLAVWLASVVNHDCVDRKFVQSPTTSEST
jgi:hypothetical protein